MDDTFISSLTDQLKKDLPGKKSHEIMRVKFEKISKRKNESIGNSSPAAVLIVYFQMNLDGIFLNKKV